MRAVKLTLVLALVAGLSPIAAADVIQSGFIVRIEDREIYFNLGSVAGLEAHDRIRIKRPIAIKHPVTRKKLKDWLPIGSADVTSVGDRLSMAVLEPDMLAQVRVGDVVEAYVERDEEILATAPQPEPEPAAQPEEPPQPEAPLPTLDEETKDVLTVWNATVGQSLDVRISAWEEYLERKPDSPYAAAVHEDLEVLRAQRERMRPSELALEERVVHGLEHKAPTRGRAGEPVPLVFLLDDPKRFGAAWLHYRARGAASYKKGRLRREGDLYLRGAIPAEAVAGPGVEYFVELASDKGDVGAAVGTPDRPEVVDVEPPPIVERFTERRRRSRMSIRATYLDFASFDGRTGQHTDQFFHFEADFLFRLRGILYGIRSGMGVFNGRGGFANRVYERTSDAPEAGFNYGYTELEFRGRHKTAFLGRLAAGVGRDGFGLGVEGRFRLGDEDATNLSLGVTKLAEIGFLTEIRMQWDAVHRVPLGLAVALTDQPSGGDLGVRLATDIGLRTFEWFQPTIRLSYQARTVVHSGLGLGIGLVFDW